MTKFERRFFRALNEQDEDRQAMMQSLDKGTDPGEFDVNLDAGSDTEVAQHTAAAIEAASRRHVEYVRRIKEWSVRLQDFLEFLNGTHNSVQSTIASATSNDDKTILAELDSEQSRITRAATEISALIQKFNAALSTEKDPSYRGV
jgi:hypothetical protein